MQTLAAFAMSLAVLLATLGGHDAEARPRYRDSSAGLRLRLEGSYGWIDYDDISRASNGRTSFVSAPHFGRRLDGELWFPRLMSPWPLFGIAGDYEIYPVRLFGRNIYYSQFSARITWRAVGEQGNWNRNELVLSAGPSVQSFPDVRGYVRTQSYDMLQAQVFGVKVEASYRFKISKNIRKWRGDLSLHWVEPLSLFRTGAAQLDNQETRTMGLAARFDYGLTDHVDVGLGFLFQKNRLSYRPIESDHPQTIEWNNIAPMISIQFWLAPASFRRF